MSTDTLWDHLARETDPSTSKAAAESIVDALPQMKARVLTALREGPATAGEIGDRIGMPCHCVSSRLNQLRSAGLAGDTDCTRPGATGRPQRVWVAL